MTIDKLGLYNGALRLCEERKLASLAENREPRRLLDDVWTEDPVRNWLEAGQWTWATRTYRLDYDPDVEPLFGYTRAFAKPDDFVRTTAISGNEFFNPPLTQFRDEMGYWFAEIDILYVGVVSDDISAGRDYSKWPAAFVRFAQADMAVEINPRLTGSRVATGDLIQIRKKRLAEAQGLDGSGRPTMFMAPGSWTQSRGGRSFRDNRRSGR